MFVYPVYPVLTRLSHRPCLPSVHPRGEHDDRDARKTTALDQFMGEIARFDDLIATEGQVRKAAKLAGNDKWSTAIHEVGHAVIGRVLKLSCGAVTALPDEDSAGHAIIHNPWVTASVWDVELERQVRSGVEDPKCRNSMSGFPGQNSRSYGWRRSGGLSDRALPGWRRRRPLSDRLDGGGDVRIAR